MYEHLFMYIGVPLVGLGVGYVLWTGMRRARIWRIAVERAARELRLKHVQPEGAISAIYDIAFGKHAGLSISIGIKDESRSGSDSETRYMLLEVSGARSGAFIGRPGAYERPYVDYADEGGDAPTPLGDAVFDGQVELRKAKRPLLEALRADVVFRQQLAQLVRDGLTIDEGSATLKTRTFPRGPDDILRQVRAMIEICRRIEKP